MIGPNKLFWLIAMPLVSLSVFSQQHFPKQIPAGNYSGICAIGDDCYAVVSDKSAASNVIYMREATHNILFTTVIGAAWQLPILSAPIETEGQIIDRKLNVALTRARKQFVLIGNETLLRTCRPYREVLEYIKSYQDAQI